jgi:hypothetical protein
MTLTKKRGRWKNERFSYLDAVKRQRERAGDTDVARENTEVVITTQWPRHSLDLKDGPRFVGFTLEQASLPNDAGFGVPMPETSKSEEMVLFVHGVSSETWNFKYQSDLTALKKSVSSSLITVVSHSSGSYLASKVLQDLHCIGVINKNADETIRLASKDALIRKLREPSIDFQFLWPRRVLPATEREDASERDQTKGLGIDWIQSAELILKRMESPDTTEPDSITSVLFAETTAFQAKDISRLLKALAAFISEHRFSTNEKMTTAVGSAIRKYAMNMSEDLFESYSTWLLPSSTETLDHQTEMELIKAFNWRLTYSPTAITTSSENVIRNFTDVCSSYLHRRVILQKSYASTVLHGLSVVAILEAISGERQRTDILFQAAKQMELKWFNELLCDRILEAVENIREHSPELAIRISLNTSAYLYEFEGSNNARMDTVG